MQMKMSLEERFQKELLKFGRKNRLCGYVAMPVLAAGLFFIRTTAYLKGNTKRLVMLAMTFFLFAVYSSFSFPIFVAGDSTDNGLNPVSEEAQSIELAKEMEIDLDSIELLEEDVLLEDYIESYGDIGELLSASEILEAAQGRVLQENRKEPATGDVEFSREDWRLLLVNKQHSIPEDYEFTLGTIKTMKGTQRCDERIIDDLLAMLQAAEEDNIKLQICSPYRTAEYQTFLFDNHIKAYMRKGLSYMEAFQLSSRAVTVPGSSEHQIGLALDIVTPSHQQLTESFEDTEAGIWLAENCYKYGFILRYPKGKEYITGIEYEPWHFRYVGVEAATVITEQGITLEEFWEDL